MDNALSLFDKETARWFSESVGEPTLVQQEGWPAIAEGAHVLISAPTGTGKTLSAFLVFIDRLKQKAREGTLAQGLHLIYISPLKALGNDIRENLKRPLSGIAGPDISVAIRTGDTPQAERQRMLRNPPHILITTPESLYLLLTSRGGRNMLKAARAIIIDELHALINGKRGAHLMLSVARLDGLCGRDIQRIGLSATIEPLSVAAEYLAAPDPVRIIAPKMHKSVDIQVKSPLKDMRVLPEGTIWPELAKMVYEHCEGNRTVIAFVEGRTQAEKLARGVNALGGEDFARTHHGSVSKEQRLEAETRLRSGKLRLLCATSSMELGIDVGEVDLVLQIGFPVTISSTMQRLGRAGHSPGRTSVMRLFPRTAAEGVTCGLTAKVALEGGIEHVNPPKKCLDVLSQQLVSMAVDNRYTVEEALSSLGRAYSFREVSRAELESVLRMLAGDFEHAYDRPVRARVMYDRIHGTVEGDAYSRILAVSAGGTIPDRGLYAARLADGTKLGELDEEFVFEARVGDKFLLGTFAWRIMEIRRDSVIVTPTSIDGAAPPFWKGDGIGRTYLTGQKFGALMRGLYEASGGARLKTALSQLLLDEDAVNNAADFVRRQIKAAGCLPDDRTIFVEHFRDEAGEHQMMAHSVFGRQVNAGLSLLISETARHETGMDFHTFDDDDGFLLFPYGGNQALPEGLLFRIDPEKARALLSALLPATPLFNMAFRYNAGRALIMGARRGGRLPLWVQRLRGAQALDNAVTQDGHPIIEETKRECLCSYLDLNAIEEVLQKIRSREIRVVETHLHEPSPMALPLRRQAVNEMMYDYTPTPRGVFHAVETALSSKEMIAPGKEQLAHAGQRARQPGDMNQLHSLMMAEGDLVAGEVDAPVAWLTALSEAGRAMYIEPGLWICAEHAEVYAAALEAGDAAARRRVVRRCLRFRGAQSAETVAERYFLSEPDALSLLLSLQDEGSAIRDGELFYHAELYERAQRETVAHRRREIQTLPPERYAALCAQRVRAPGRPEEQLLAAMEQLAGRAFPLALWESVLLPARVSGYRPAMLDALLTQGAYFWQIERQDRPMLSFHRFEAIDWEAELLFVHEALSPEEETILGALSRRGAVFAQGLSGLLGGLSPLPQLLALAERGLARADSFLPVRQIIENEAGKDPGKQRARARATAATAGRWELTRPLLQKTAEERVEAAFDGALLLCRETARELPFGEALSVLRVWEYMGRARRGYFIRGLSGAQFIREADFAGALYSLQSPRKEIIWLSAVDPLQAWGRVLPHEPEKAFVCVAGTVVALYAGRPVALFERNGQALRVFDMELAQEALLAFARDYEQGYVYSGRKRITVKQYPQEAEGALREAGFTRQMMEYELWQKRI